MTTGAIEAGAHAKLGRARLNHYFLVGGYGSDSEDRVQLTRPQSSAVSGCWEALSMNDQIAVVGDTPLDIAAAQEVDVVSIGVASGKYDLDELRVANPDYALASLAEPFPGLDN